MALFVTRKRASTARRRSSIQGRERQSLVGHWWSRYECCCCRLDLAKCGDRAEPHHFYLIGILDLDLDCSRQTPNMGIRSTNVDGGLVQATLEAVDGSRLGCFFVQIVPLGDCSGKKFLYAVVDDKMQSNLYGWLHLVRGSAEIRGEDGIDVRPWAILNMVVNLWFFRRCSRVGHCSFTRIINTLLCCRWSPAFGWRRLASHQAMTSVEQSSCVEAICGTSVGKSCFKPCMSSAMRW